MTTGSARRRFASADEIVQAKGEALGISEWRPITQEQINLFADATDDHQRIHIDLERAAAGPFGAPIALGTASRHWSHLASLVNLPAAG